MVGPVGHEQRKKMKLRPSLPKLCLGRTSSKLLFRLWAGREKEFREQAFQTRLGIGEKTSYLAFVSGVSVVDKRAVRHFPRHSGEQLMSPKSRYCNGLWHVNATAAKRHARRGHMRGESVVQNSSKTWPLLSPDGNYRNEADLLSP